MNIPAFIEGIFLIISFFVIVNFLAFGVTTYYEFMYQKIKWKKDDYKFNQSLKELEDDHITISKKEYEELKKVN